MFEFQNPKININLLIYIFFLNNIKYLKKFIKIYKILQDVFLVLEVLAVSTISCP
jgi:hypothetical protein